MLIALAGLALLVAACASGSTSSTLPPRSGELLSSRGYAFPSAPPVPDGPLDTTSIEALDRLIESLTVGIDYQALGVVADSKDARLAWLVADLLRFLQAGKPAEELAAGFERLTGADLELDPASRLSLWGSATDHLIAWDLPAPPRYRELKARVFLLVEPRWEPFFADEDAAIDWRLVSWGGVLMDDRQLGDPEPCPYGCIPALDDPGLTDAAGADWYSDGYIVFGITIGDEAVAIQRNIMEVHELVNLTINGRRLGIPYCTLCGSAQAYFTDSVPDGVEVPVLRTSGLLSRSNKVMYDLNTASVFDTFTGEAVSGPLQDASVELEQTTVVSSTWGDWKVAHPLTRIVARDGGIGREYPADPLGGRDADGPIFPVGPVDPRLPVQAQVLGVISPDGTPIAFPVDQVKTALERGQAVAVGEVELVGDGSGLRARSKAGGEIAAHQSFWFAWSQFHPTTVVWSPLQTG